MVANSKAFSRLVDGGHNIADYLARKLAPAHLLRVVIEMSMVLHAQGKSNLLLYSVLKQRVFSAGGLLMLRCDRSLPRTATLYW
jgi:hypothetical protein